MAREHEKFIHETYHTDEPAMEKSHEVNPPLARQDRLAGNEREVSKNEAKFVDEMYHTDTEKEFAEAQEEERTNKLLEAKRQRLIGVVRDALRSEKQGAALMKGLIGEKRTDLFLPLRDVFLRVEGIFDLEERINALRRSHGREKISPELLDILTRALDLDAAQTIQFLGRFSRKKIQEQTRALGKEMFTREDREAMEETARTIYDAFVGHAERLIEQYQGKFPQAAQREMQREVRSLDRMISDYIRSHLGGFVIAEIEQGSSLQDEENMIQQAIHVMRILFGRPDEMNLLNSSTLYEAMYKRGVGRDVFTTRIQGVPLFTLTGMKELALKFRAWLHTNPEIPREEIGVLTKRHLRPLEGFIRTSKNEGVREAIREAQLDDILEAQLVRQVEKVLDINRDLAEEFSKENILQRLQQEFTQTKKAVRDQAERAAYSAQIRTLADIKDLQTIITHALQLDERGAQELKEIVNARSQDASEIELGKVLIGSGQETEYTPFAFSRLITQYTAEVDGAIRTFQNEHRRDDAIASSEELQELYKMRAVLERIQDEEKYTYGQRLTIAYRELVISQEEYEAYKSFLSGASHATEIEAKKMGDEIENLEDFLSGNPSKRRKRVAERRLEQASRNREKLENRAKNFNEGVI